MKTYDLYLDSGPMRKKTIVQIPSLMGCMGRGDTTDAAVAGAPDAIRTFLRFLARHGERVDPDEPFRTRVAAHVIDSVFPAGGTSFLPPDERPLGPRETAALMSRLEALHGDLRTLTSKLTARHMDARPAKGRPIRQILAHICVEGAYLRGVSGASRIQRLVDRGEMDPHDALDDLLARERERLRAMPASERSGVVLRGQSPWSARGAVRRMLEHGWEHYVEIAERLGVDP